MKEELKKEELLKLEHLSIQYKVKGGYLSAVNDVNLSISRGEVFAVVGESGCGKSTVAHSIMNLIPGGNSRVTGKILFNGEDLNACSDKKMESIRGKHIGMIFQNPLDSLNPVYTTGSQVEEAILLDGLNHAQAWEKVLKLYQDVKMPDARERAKSYPHEMSGGMRQRVMIAMMLSRNPELLIADEPTTALDVTIQGQILDIIKELQREHNTSVIMITHDLGVVANIAQKIAVMYSGMIVERGSCEDIFYRPRHPYTWALIRSVPRLDLENKQVLASIPGTPPDLLNPPVGCPFYTRCEYCMEICKEQMPEVTEFGDGHEASCWLHHPLAPKVEMPGEA